MNWGSIKQTLNSTLCTSSFLPLDKMIENAKLYLSNKIDNNQTNIIKSFGKLETSTTGTGVLLKNTNYTFTGDVTEKRYLVVDKFIAPVSGIYKVTIKVYGKSESSDPCPYYCFYKIPPQNIPLITRLEMDDNTGAGYAYSTQTQYIKGWELYKNYSIGMNDNNLNTYDDELIKAIGEHICDMNDYSEKIDGDYHNRVSSGYFYALAGQPIVILGHNNSNSTIHLNKYNCVITYGNS